MMTSNTSHYEREGGFVAKKTAAEHSLARYWHPLSQWYSMARHALFGRQLNWYTTDVPVNDALPKAVDPA
jgi:hypothetical protein